MGFEIIDRIRSAESLPSLPSVVLDVLELTNRDEVSISEIVPVIQRDPALTGKVLKVANSSIFGMPRKIASLQQAMVVLGLRAVKVLALSFSLIDVVHDETEGGFDYPGYWRRSLTTAVTARLLGERCNRVLADEMFVCGLLCDIGVLAAFRWAKPLYAPVLAAYKKGSQPLQQVELKLLDVSHERIGEELLKHWGLPGSLYQAVGTHHSQIGRGLPDDPQDAMMAKVLRSAAEIADLFCADVGAERLKTLRKEIVGALPLDEAQLDEVLQALDGHVREAAPLFQVRIAATRTYAEIQTEAASQLARLSMSAELERAEIARREKQARQQVEELSDQNRELAERAVTDELTGVGNRTSLEERLRHACRVALSEQTPVGLLFLDLDRFKRLNDRFGHRAGDQALQTLGSLLRGLANDKVFAARYGGEEFVIVVSGSTAGELRKLAERVREDVQQIRIPFGSQLIGFTVSIGVVHMSSDDPHLCPGQLLERADRCLYQAKAAGRNRVVAYQPESEPKPAMASGSW